MVCRYINHDGLLPLRREFPHEVAVRGDTFLESGEWLRTDAAKGWCTAIHSDHGIVLLLSDPDTAFEFKMRYG